MTLGYVGVLPTVCYVYTPLIWDVVWREVVFGGVVTELFPFNSHQTPQSC